MKITVLGTTLDKEQTKAAIMNHKNSMIIAGAGSGKSLTIVGKVKYLVQEKGIPLNQILCITFTNNAAKSLEEKIKKELHLENKVYTFHKLAMEILETFSFHFQVASDNLLEYTIDEILHAISPSSFLEKYFLNKNYLFSDDFIQFKKLILSFIRIFISNHYTLENFSKIIKHARKKDKTILLFIQKIYEMYLLEKTSSGFIDFDDMIYLATKTVKERGIKQKYQYIIIDEYQDTSKLREDLIREIIKQTKAIITVVGDDFQSIYRFSGCDIQYFLDFPIRFFPTKKLYLTHTYRNSHELIHVAGSFILENKKQIYKKLVSSKHIERPIVLCYYRNITKDFRKLLEFINQDNIMVLGRNNRDIESCFDHDMKMIDYKIIYQNKNIYYKTIHKAKGLEEENVILINLTNDIYSLPSKVKNDSLLKYVIHKDTYPFEEERRLFYVALTRTKKYCYLFVPKKNPSIFVEELVKNYKKYITIISL